MNKERKEKKLSFPTNLGVTYIFVVDAFHEHQLPVRPLGVGLVLEGSAQLLDGHISVQDSVVACTAEQKPSVSIARRACDQPSFQKIF